MPQTQQYEFREEQPSIISYSEYMLTTTETIYVGQPVEVDTSQGTSGVSTGMPNQNKVWCKRYTTADSTAKCLGVATKPVFPVGHANAHRAGLGGYMRDLALLQFGLIPMFNCCDSDVTVGQAVSPVSLGDGSGSSTDQTVVGFKNWEAGESILGFVHEYNIPGYDSGNDVVHLGLIFVMASAVASATSMDGLSDTDITAAISGDILVHDGSNWVDVALTVSAITNVTETSIASGQTLMYNGSAYVNATLITEFVTTSDGGTNHESEALTGTPLAVVAVKPSGVGQTSVVEYTYDATATVPTLTYNWATTVISKNKATDADTHLIVTYWYAENA